MKTMKRVGQISQDVLLFQKEMEKLNICIPEDIKGGGWGAYLLDYVQNIATIS